VGFINGWRIMTLKGDCNGLPACYGCDQRPAFFSSLFEALLCMTCWKEAIKDVHT